MITKHDLRKLDFTEVEQYYELISETYNEGKLKEVNTLVARLSENQKKECVRYISENISEYCEILKYLIQVMI
jgi:hypothetical protein